MIIVPKLVCNHMENIAGTLAVCNVIMIHVTKLMEDASSVVKMDFMAHFAIKKIR